MNLKEFLCAAVLTGGLLSASTLASAVVVDSAATTDVASYTAPAPVKIVAPTGIARRFQGGTIRLSLTVDAAGRPRNISLLSGRDANLERNLLPAVAQWKFAPAMKNGRPVATQIVLPLELVDAPTS